MRGTVFLALLAGCASSGLEDPADLKGLAGYKLDELFETALGLRLYGVPSYSLLAGDYQLPRGDGEPPSCVVKQELGDRTRWSVDDCELYTGEVADGAIESSEDGTDRAWERYTLADEDGQFAVNGTLYDKSLRGDRIQRVDLEYTTPEQGRMVMRWEYWCDDHLVCGMEPGGTLSIDGFGDMWIERTLTGREVPNGNQTDIHYLTTITLEGKQTLVFTHDTTRQCASYTVGNEAGNLCE